MGDGPGAFALANGRQAPLLRAGSPTGPGLIAGDHPARTGGIGAAPFGGDVLFGLKLHFAEFLPDAGFVVAGVNADDDVVLGFDPGAGIGGPEGVGIGLDSAVGGGAGGRGAVLVVLVEAVLVEVLGHAIGAEGVELGDADLAARLLHPIAIDGVSVVDGGGRVIEIGVKLGDLLARDGVNLRVAEEVGVFREGDDEGLVGEVDGDQRDLELLAGGDEFGVGPIDAGDGVIVGPGHGVLVLDFLGIDGRRRDGLSQGGAGGENQKDDKGSHNTTP